MSQTLCEQLHLEGPSTKLLLTTMQEQNVKVKTSNISGLEVLDYRRVCVVKMPVASSREVVSANRSQIPKPEVAREREHLKSIADRITPYHPDAEISILIGNNCPKAIQPREIQCRPEISVLRRRKTHARFLRTRVFKYAFPNAHLMRVFPFVIQTRI